jgi:hypothetical protein
MLEDDDIMPWGMYAGRPLSIIPRDYWQWLWKQDWFRDKDEHADLRAYCCRIIYSPEDFDVAVRMLFQEPRRVRRSPPIDDDDGDYGIGISDPFANA